MMTLEKFKEKHGGDSPEDYLTMLAGSIRHAIRESDHITKPVFNLDETDAAALDDIVAFLGKRNDKLHAGMVLGIRGENYRSIPTDCRDVDALRLTLALKDAHLADVREGHRAEVEALHKRLKSAHKSKHLANRRADMAEQAMRNMLDNFKATEVTE